MIYLIDQPLTETSHSRFMIDIIKQHTSVGIELVALENITVMNDIYQIIADLAPCVTARDIVLIPWCVPADYHLDALVESLTYRVQEVVVAAGNFSSPIETISPARAPLVTTVGTLNKQGLFAKLSNYSDSKEIVWIPGTNYDVGWKNSSGTSVSAALYTAWLAEAIKAEDYRLLDQKIAEQKAKVLAEINQA